MHGLWVVVLCHQVVLEGLVKRCSHDFVPGRRHRAVDVEGKELELCVEFVGACLVAGIEKMMHWLHVLLR